MTDLHEIAESAAICTDEQIANAYREIRKPIAPEKPSERVENAALLVGVIALLAGFLT